MSELQKLIQERLDELQISLRAAAARSNGLTTATTLSRLALGKHTGRITADTISGIALALDLSQSAVRKAAEADTAPARWLELSETAARTLPPERLAAIMEVAERELAAFHEDRRQEVREARPFS